MLKRAFDIFGATLGLLLLAPAGLVIALMVKFLDQGPVFFGQTRIGQFGRPFRMWKFRSMVSHAEQVGAPITGAEDARITRVGRWLRKTKLDELPQLWNVLIGDMSLVGPRPEVPSFVARYTQQQRQILRFKPGITDVASLLFRNEESLLAGAKDIEGFYLRYCVPKKIQLNLEYARDASLLQDFCIILQTVFPYWLGVLGMYTCCLVFGFWFAYLLGSDFSPTAQEQQQFVRFLGLMVLPQLSLLVWRGQLRGLLSYFSLSEVRRTVLALAGALLVQVVLCYPFQAQVRPSPSVLVMDFIISVFTLCGIRTLLRVGRERYSHASKVESRPPRRVAIIGTGSLATNLVADLAHSQCPARRVVALFDDDPHTWHKRPHDVPVVGMPECLLNRKWVERIDEVIVALPEEESSRIRELSDLLKPLPIKISIASDWLGLHPA